MLLLNPAKKGTWGFSRINMGLLSLGTILNRHGAVVRVVDYGYLAHLPAAPPPVHQVVAEFRPDCIGVTAFTFMLDACQAILDDLRKVTDVPILIGGPHVTLFPDEFLADTRVDTVVTGEAVTVIVNLVADARRRTRPIRVDAPAPSAADIPRLNLRIALGCEHLTDYQIQISRGCPYRCTFCTVDRIAGRQLRARDVTTCLEEIRQAKQDFPNISRISVTDDCPTFDLARFKRFLQGLAELNLGCDIWIDNARANLLDADLLALYARAGGRNICLGVETGSVEVFNRINKGESLEEIAHAADLVRRQGLELGLCFVIGLPGDNPAHHRESMAFARRLKPDYIFWNMCVPWPGTPVYDWFRDHGSIYDYHNFSPLMGPRVEYQRPVCESPDFTSEQRLTAWLSANLETHYFFRCPKDILRLGVEAWRCACIGAFWHYLIRYGWRACVDGAGRAVHRGFLRLRRNRR